MKLGVFIRAQCNSGSLISSLINTPDDSLAIICSEYELLSILSSHRRLHPLPCRFLHLLPHHPPSRHFFDMIRRS